MPVVPASRCIDSVTCGRRASRVDAREQQIGAVRQGVRLSGDRPLPRVVQRPDEKRAC
jgi:hypothetical protein